MSLPAVEYDLVTDPRSGYLFARVRTVALTSEVASRLLPELRRALLDARRTRLMLEYDVAHALTEDEALEFRNNMIKVLPGMRIAFVTEDAKHDPSLRFGTAVAEQAREDHRFFTDTASA